MTISRAHFLFNYSISDYHPTPEILNSYNLGQNKKELSTPFPQKNNDSAEEQKRAILASLKWGGGGAVQLFHLFCPRFRKIIILDRMKRNNKPPSSQSNDEGAKEQKRAILGSLKWGEGWSRSSIYFEDEGDETRPRGCKYHRTTVRAC